jgi:nitrogen fixation NifU-like protein
MNSDLGDLYQQLILDHNRRPHNFGVLPHATHRADGYNPLCGDKFTVYLQLEADGRIGDVRFDGQGCAISKASASLMTDRLKGLSALQADSLFKSFHALLAGEPDADSESLGKLAAFSGVREFPMRVKCATLAWHTFRAALRQATATVCTDTDSDTAEGAHG